jgi:NAD(P)-dependent dehydrogenase (short-subunit alcohol dehydrogenase family)
MSFEDRCVIVTGAAGNLGAAVARECARQGGDLVLVDRDEGPLEAIASGLGARKAPLIIAGADVRKPADCAAIAERALAAFGRIDALANTVGGFRMGAIAENAAADWAFLMDLNALSALTLSAALVPAMKARRYGRICHVAAAPGLRAPAGLGVYAASKAAVIRLTEALAEEHRRDAITANCVLPTTIDTPQNRAADPKADTALWVAPEAIARVIVFLVSAEAGAVTGAAVPVNGKG